MILVKNTKPFRRLGGFYFWGIERFIKWPGVGGWKRYNNKKYQGAAEP